MQTDAAKTMQGYETFHMVTKFHSTIDKVDLDLDYS